MTVSAYRNVDSEWTYHFVRTIEGVNLSYNTLPYVFAARRTVGLLSKAAHAALNPDLLQNNPVSGRGCSA